MNNFRIQLCMENAYEHVNFARANDFFYEITDFALPRTLNNEIELRNTVEFYQRRFSSDDTPRTMHGPFIDIYISSPDQSIRKASRKRVINSFLISKKLGVDAIIFHTNFIPLIREQRYEDSWLEENVDFWGEMVSSFDTKVYLENMWDTSPYLLNKLMQAVGNPNLGVCFDIGHCNVYSESPIKEWISILGKSIEYMHINDNNGRVDEHLAVGEGSIKWDMFAECLSEVGSKLDIVFEVQNLAAVKRSITNIGTTEARKLLNKIENLKRCFYE